MAEDSKKESKKNELVLKLSAVQEVLYAAGGGESFSAEAYTGFSMILKEVSEELCDL